MRRRWGAALLLVGGLILAPGTGFAQEVAPGLGIWLLEAPVERAGDPRAEIYVIDHLAPSQTIRRGIAVSNGTDDTVTVRLYPVAARVSGDGFHLAADESASELVDWVDVEPATLTLAPGGSRAATVTITAAPDATPGEHYGAVLAELPGDPDAPVAVTSRVGIRLYLSVGRGAPGWSHAPASSSVLPRRRSPSRRPPAAGRTRSRRLPCPSGVRGRCPSCSSRVGSCCSRCWPCGCGWRTAGSGSAGRGPATTPGDGDGAGRRDPEG